MSTTATNPPTTVFCADWFEGPGCGGCDDSHDEGSYMEIYGLVYCPVCNDNYCPITESACTVCVPPAPVTYCKYHFNGTCRFGDGCNFSHDRDGYMQLHDLRECACGRLCGSKSACCKVCHKTRVQICFAHFSDGQTCERDSCPYSHERTDYIEESRKKGHPIKDCPVDGCDRFCGIKSANCKQCYLKKQAEGGGGAPDEPRPQQECQMCNVLTDRRLCKPCHEAEKQYTWYNTARTR